MTQIRSGQILDGTIVNADIAAAAAIAYSKLNLTGLVVNADLVSIAWSKITATPTTLAGYGIADPVVLTSGSYANPAWITSLAGAKITGAVGSATLAAAATVLATPRAINGTNFDGSADITIAAAAGTLTGTTLAAGVVTSSLTTVGALNAGSITSGFGAINIGTDALTAGAISGSGLLSMTGFGTHVFSGSSNSGLSVNVANTNAGNAAFARFSLTTDEGIAGGLSVQSSTFSFTAGAFNIASSCAFEAIRVGGLSLAATNAAGTVRIYAGSNTGLIATFAPAALTLTVPLTLKGYTVATLPAGVVGRVAYATDLLAPAYGVAAVGGGAVTGRVFYNGAAWTT